jgi:hypothetical protein
MAKQESSGRFLKQLHPNDELNIAMGSAYAMPNEIGIVRLMYYG